jgi:hypothetical protein
VENGFLNTLRALRVARHAVLAVQRAGRVPRLRQPRVQRPAQPGASSCTHADTRAEHDALVRQVLLRLIDNKLYAKLTECEFGRERIEFLGHIFSPVGAETDPCKIASVLDWPAPRNVNEVQQFLGLVNYHRRSISAVSRVALPLTRLLRKYVSWSWGAEQQTMFKMLRAAFKRRSCWPAPTQKRSSWSRQPRPTTPLVASCLSATCRDTPCAVRLWSGSGKV